MPAGPTQLRGDEVGARLEEALPGIVQSSNEEWIEVDPTRLQEALRWPSAFGRSSTPIPWPTGAS